jgi:cyanobactin maturation PatA/PatG family protease
VLNTAVLGISQDPVAANAAFARKYGLPFLLLSDIGGEVCRAYGACAGVPPAHSRRNTYVIDPNGAVLRIYNDVDPENQVEIILAFLRDTMEQDRRSRSTIQAGMYDAGVYAQTGGQRQMDEQADFENGQDRASAVKLAQVEIDKPAPGYGQTIVPSQLQTAPGIGSPIVFALGTIGYDFVSEPRRDSLVQHIGANPNDAAQLLAYLDKDPSQAAAIIWTLNLDATPIYAIQPVGAFAHLGYERLRQFLREQITEGVERVSICGRLAGQVQLMSGQIVPMLLPEMRYMYSWTTAALVAAVAGEPPAQSAKAEEQETYSLKTQAVTNFLERIYHELRNLGLTSQERAINYAAANAMNAERIFEAALRENMELDTIEVERSPICRLESDCWDVKLTFFNPRKVYEQARKVYRFTVDVSECPVMVGKVRSWYVR